VNRLSGFEISLSTKKAGLARLSPSPPRESANQIYTLRENFPEREPLPLRVLEALRLQAQAYEQAILLMSW
jgi:hypothetical protein